jgi:hypothetical protein
LRHWALQRLGFASYDAYLRSAHWQDVRDRYAMSDRPQDCALCGHGQDLDHHHLTYERIGCELLTDIVRLCRRCHTMVHVLERRGDADISFDGIVDAGRARAYFAQRQEAVERARDENAQPRVAGFFDKASRETLEAPPNMTLRSWERLQLHKARQAEAKAAKRVARESRAKAA